MQMVGRDELHSAGSRESSSLIVTGIFCLHGIALAQRTKLRRLMTFRRVCFAHDT